MAHARGFCGKHYTRFMKHGDPLIVVPIQGRPLKGAAPTFTAIHKRLSRTRGPASQQVCVDCGGEAREWSYDGLDDDQLIDPAHNSAYSLDLAHYVARCVSCHRRFDNAGWWLKGQEHRVPVEGSTKTYADPADSGARITVARMI